jgi:hypothetical protein
MQFPDMSIYFPYQAKDFVYSLTLKLILRRFVRLHLTLLSMRSLHHRSKAMLHCESHGILILHCTFIKIIIAEIIVRKGLPRRYGRQKDTPSPYFSLQLCTFTPVSSSLFSVLIEDMMKIRLL